MSDTYRALTRKYRPRTFEDIVSQEHVSGTLRNAIEQNRLSHAYLFTGPRGVGKTTMARVLARMVNGIDDSVDGENLSATLDITEIDAASNNGIDDVRTLREWVRVPPQVGTYKVYIIDEVHMLSKAAFNALLKTLEEPPRYILFIFATTEPHKLLPTVLSRCQRFDFRRIKVSEIVSRLRHISAEESITIDEESLHVIAQRADGALRDALSIMDQAIAFCGNTIRYEELMAALNIVSNEHLFNLVEAFRSHDVAAGLALIDQLLMLGHDMQELLLSLTEHLRNMYLAKDTQHFFLIEATDETKARIRQAADAFSTDDLLRMMHISSEAQFKVKQAQQPRIQLEIAILKLLTMERADGLNALLQEIAELKALIAASGVPRGAVSSEKKTEAPPLTETRATVSKDEPAQSEPGAGAGSVPSTPVVSKPAAPPPPAKPVHPQADPQPVQKETTQTPGTTTPGQPVEIDLFGKPAIQRPVNALQPVHLQQESGSDTKIGHISGNLALAAQPETETGPAGAETVVYETVYLHDVREKWNDYLNTVRESLSNNLYFTLARTQPSDIKDELLTLECQDHLTESIIKENRINLGRSWKSVFGKSLVIQTRIVQNNAREEPDDPYTRFRKAQKNDPVLRSIVDIFGAELEY